MILAHYRYDFCNKSHTFSFKKKEPGLQDRGCNHLLSPGLSTNSTSPKRSEEGVAQRRYLCFRRIDPEGHCVYPPFMGRTTPSNRKEEKVNSRYRGGRRCRPPQKLDHLLLRMASDRSLSEGLFRDAGRGAPPTSNPAMSGV